MAALNDPDQQHPELIELGDEVINNPNYPPWPVEVVSKWRIGSQLRHAMETESAIIGHKQGAVEFIRLLHAFEEDDMQKVYPRDIDIILEIMCTFDRCDLLKLLIEHRYLCDFMNPNKKKALMVSGSSLTVDDMDESESSNRSIQRRKTYNPLQSTLKKSIRSGKINVLNYLISQNIIPIKLFDSDQIQSKQYETDLKSLLYNILRAIEIGSKNMNSTTRSNCFECARRFWPYLATKVNDLKQSLFTNVTGSCDNKALKTLMNADEDEKEDDALRSHLKAMNDDDLIIKYMAMFMMTMFSKKQIAEDRLMAIFEVLTFQRERFITFGDRENMAETRNAWKVLYHQLVLNYVESDYSDSNACTELEIIDYLISGGVSINDADRTSIQNNEWLLKAIQNGENNWRLRKCSQQTIKEMMPDILPLEINKLIIVMLCL
eukprot:309999_1